MLLVRGLGEVCTRGDLDLDLGLEPDRGLLTGDILVCRLSGGDGVLSLWPHSSPYLLLPSLPEGLSVIRSTP
jgi:hypothetical protein